MWYLQRQNRRGGDKATKFRGRNNPQRPKGSGIGTAGAVLNNWYLHDANDEEGKWEETEAWFDSLHPSEKDSVRSKSLERIFDKDDTGNDWKFVQATFWELRIKQVKSVRKFTGRGRKPDAEIP